MRKRHTLGATLRGHWSLWVHSPRTVIALAFVVMIVLSRHPLVVEVKRQFCRSEKMKMLLRAG